MIAYILISLISACVGAVIASMVIVCHTEAPAPWNMSKSERDITINAQIAYLEYLYGVDDHLRIRRESN